MKGFRLSLSLMMIVRGKTTTNELLCGYTGVRVRVRVLLLLVDLVVVE